MKVKGLKAYTRVINFRVTEEEIIILRETAEAKGLTLSQYIRSVLMED